MRYEAQRLRGGLDVNAKTGAKYQPYGYQVAKNTNKFVPEWSYFLTTNSPTDLMMRQTFTRLGSFANEQNPRQKCV